MHMRRIGIRRQLLYCAGANRSQRRQERNSSHQRVLAPVAMRGSEESSSATQVWLDGRINLLVPVERLLKHVSFVSTAEEKGMLAVCAKNP